MADELRRLYLEPTSRCNLNCAMCFRKSWVDEEAGDMDEATFRAVLAHLPPGVETLFSGAWGSRSFIRTSRIWCARPLPPVCVPNW